MLDAATVVVVRPPVVLSALLLVAAVSGGGGTFDVPCVLVVVGLVRGFLSIKHGDGYSYTDHKVFFANYCFLTLQ